MSPKARWTLWYVLCTGALGSTPYFAVLLADAGWADTHVPWLLMASPIALLTSGPQISRVADRLGQTPLALRLVTGAVAVAIGGLLLAQSPVAFAAVFVALSLLRAPLYPLADAQAVTQLGDDYGRVRALGSASYLTVAFGCGQLRDDWPAIPLVMGTTLLALAAVWSWALPKERPSSAPAALGRPLDQVLRTPGLLPLLAVCLLHGLTVATYDNLFSLRVESAELPAWVTGTGIAIGVGVEVCVMWLGRPLLARLGPVWLLRIGVIAGIPRFVVTGLVDDPVILAATQALHGIQFGAYWIAVVAIVQRTIPPGDRATVQSLVTGAGFGIGALFALVVAGSFMNRIGIGPMFVGLSGCSALATVVAFTLRPPTTNADAEAPAQ